MANLLKWMEKEMAVRLRSGAVIRKTGNQTRLSVHTVTVLVTALTATLPGRPVPA